MIGSLVLTLLSGTMPTLTVRVEGDGFFRFAKGNQIYYARQAKLSATNQGLVGGDGSLLVPRLVAPSGTTKLEVSMDGTISAILANGKKQMGRIVLAMFEPTTAFTHVGNYVTTSIKPTLTNPGEGIAGVIRTNMILANSAKAGSTGSAAAPAKTTAAESFYSPTAEVTVNLSSEIDTDHILLGSIAKIEGDPELKEKLAAVDFGKAPLYGSKRGLTVLHVRANILAARIDATKVKIIVPEGATVERKSQKVDPAAVADAVAKAFKTKYGFETQLQEKMKVVSYSVPAGDLTLDVSQLNLNNTEITGVVDIAVNGKIVNSVRINYDLPSLSMVKRGDVVRLRLISNFAQVEVSAKATSNGYLGQQITVQTDNGTSHTGTLIGSNIVEVKL